MCLPVRAFGQPGDYGFTIAKTKNGREFILDFWAKDNIDMEIFPVAEAAKKLYDHQPKIIRKNGKFVDIKHEVVLFDPNKQAIKHTAYASLKEYEQWRCRQIDAESFIDMSETKLNEDYFSIKNKT